MNNENPNKNNVVPIEDASSAPLKEQFDQIANVLGDDVAHPLRTEATVAEPVVAEAPAAAEQEGEGVQSPSLMARIKKNGFKIGALVATPVVVAAALHGGPSEPDKAGWEKAPSIEYTVPGYTTKSELAQELAENIPGEQKLDPVAGDINSRNPDMASQTAFAKGTKLELTSAADQDPETPGLQLDAPKPAPLPNIEQGHVMQAPESKPEVEQGHVAVAPEKTESHTDTTSTKPAPLPNIEQGHVMKAPESKPAPKPEHKPVYGDPDYVGPNPNPTIDTLPGIG